MTWANKARFEALLITAALVETAHLAGLFERRAEVDGLALAILFTVAAPWVTVLIGLGITRWGSGVAKYVFLFLMAIVWLNMVKLGLDAWWGKPALMLGFLAGGLQTLAASMLMTSSGWRWTVGPRRNPALA